MATSKSKKSPQSFKCQHCEFVGKTKAGLTKHNTAKHDGQQSKIGSTDGGGVAFTPQQEHFCILYASDKEFLGNGVQSYIEAYNIKVGRGKGFTTYETCKFMAHRLLKNPKILKRINEIFEGRGLNPAFVDKQLEFLITQSSEFRPKLGAIQEYNKLTKRTSDRVEHVHAFSDISKMSDTEIAAEKERLQNFFAKK